MSHRAALTLAFAVTVLFAAMVVLGRDRLVPAVPAGTDPATASTDPAPAGEPALVELVTGDALAASVSDATVPDAPTTGGAGLAARLASFSDIPAQDTAGPAVQVAPIPDLKTAPSPGGGVQADAPPSQADVAPAYGDDSHERDSSKHGSDKHDSRKHGSDKHGSDDKHHSGDDDD